MGTFGIQAGQAAVNTASGLLGGIFGLATAGINDKRQIRQQEKLNELAYNTNNRMAEADYQRQLRMWQATGYGAQMKQLQEAGLNPGLLYGMSGGGGQTTGTQSGGHVAAGNAPSGGGEIAMGIQAGLQTQMMQAQIKLAESQANKNNVEAGYTAGAQTEKTYTEIENIKQGMKNQAAQQILTEAQTDLLELQNKFTQATLETAIAHAEANLKTTVNELERAVRRNWIEENTKNTAINQIKQDYLKTLAETELTKQLKQASIKGMQLNDAQIQRLAQETSIAWAQLSNQQQQTGINKAELAIKKFETAVSNAFPGTQQTLLHETGYRESIKKLYEELEQAFQNPK